jgi:selenoprotein W-related protein
MPKMPVKVAITYCAECGYEEPTLRLVRRLMDEFQMFLSEIKLIPAAGGELEVVLNGDLVHSTRTSGLFPKADEIVEEVRRRIG